jgi:hypothetical protein
MMGSRKTRKSGKGKKKMSRENTQNAGEDSRGDDARKGEIFGAGVSRGAGITGCPWLAYVGESFIDGGTAKPGGEFLMVSANEFMVAGAATLGLDEGDLDDRVYEGGTTQCDERTTPSADAAPRPKHEQDDGQRGET